MKNTIETNNNGFVFYTLDTDWNIGDNIRKGNIWEPYIGEYIKHNLGNSSIFVDIGSNYGYHSIVASKVCEKVYSYEPQKLLYGLQLKTILNNNITNVELNNVAIGDSDGEIEMEPINYDEVSNIGNLSIGSGGELVKTMKLDSINFESIDLIKIDVQGYEMFVINGAEVTIKKHRPVMIIEFEEVHTTKFGYGCKDLFNHLKGLDYVLYQFNHIYPSDYLCVPVEKNEVFRNTNKNRIELLTENNEINFGLDNGIVEKIIY